MSNQEVNLGSRFPFSVAQAATFDPPSRLAACFRWGSATPEQCALFLGLQRFGCAVCIRPGGLLEMPSRSEYLPLTRNNAACKAESPLALHRPLFRIADGPEVPPLIRGLARRSILSFQRQSFLVEGLMSHSAADCRSPLECQ